MSEKLYNVPKRSRIRMAETDFELEFHNIDGIFSYCKDDNGLVYHLAYWTEVEIVRRGDNNE